MDINEIVPTKSYNAGTQRGSRVLKRTIKELGCGRSIVVDRNNNVIVGNNTLEQAKKAGVEKVVVVETKGAELVVVKRLDIDINTRKAKEIALVDNLSSELGINYDTDFILQDMNSVWGFDPRNWEGHGCLVQELTVEDCIKEGVAAVQRKETAQQEQTPEEQPMQLSLFESL